MNLVVLTSRSPGHWDYMAEPSVHTPQHCADRRAANIDRAIGAGGNGCLGLLIEGSGELPARRNIWKRAIENLGPIRKNCFRREHCQNGRDAVHGSHSISENGAEEIAIFACVGVGGVVEGRACGPNHGGRVGQIGPMGAVIAADLPLNGWGRRARGGRGEDDRFPAPMPTR